MNRFVYKRIEMDYVSRVELLARLSVGSWSRGMEQGFSMGLVNDKQIRGRWVYKDRGKYDCYDEDTLEKITKTLERRMCAPFFIDYERSILRCESSGDSKRVIEALEAVPGVSIFVEDLDIDMHALHDAFCEKYKKNQLETLGLSDVIHDKILITDANFKLLEHDQQGAAVDKYRDRIKQLNFLVKDEFDVYPVRVARGGTVSYDEDAPSNTLNVLEDMIMAFHRAAGTVSADNVDVKMKSPKKPNTAKKKDADA